MYNAMYMFFIPLQLPTVCLKRIWEEEREGPELGCAVAADLVVLHVVWDSIGGLQK